MTEDQQNILKAATDNDIEKLKEILLINKSNKNSIIDCKDPDGNTALIKACENNNHDVAELLISQGADVNLQNKDGNSALYFAATYGRFGTMSLLLENGADVNIKNIKGQTPINAGMFASIKHPENISFLLDNGADINNQCAYGISPIMEASSLRQLKIVEMLIEKGADVNLKDQNGETALFKCYSKESVNIMELLIKKGADVNVQNNNRGNTPLINVSYPGHSLSDGKNEANYGAMALLLDNGADINKQNHDGCTALMMSCTTNINDPKATAILLEHGPDLDLRDSKDMSAEDIAKFWGATAKVAAIEKYKLQAEIDAEPDKEEIQTETELTGPAKTYADRSALELKKLKARDAERDSELSMGL